MSVQRRYTSADLEAMPYDEWHRYEIIDGELFVSSAPSWNHNRAAKRLCTALDNWGDETGLGEAMHVPGLIFTDDNNVIPDLVWVSREKLDRGLDGAGHLTVAPDIVVETLSPGPDNARRDRVAKFGLYSRQGVQEYWLVDPALRIVEVFRHDGRALELVASLSGDDALTSPLLPGFACPLSRLW
jgi:Uma2 family endonuclease